MEKEVKDRYCEDDELWVCSACGKHVEHDRYCFKDVACMLNAFKAKKDRVVYEDDDPEKRVTYIKTEEEDGHR